MTGNDTIYTISNMMDYINRMTVSTLLIDLWKIYDFGQSCSGTDQQIKILEASWAPVEMVKV